MAGFFGEFIIEWECLKPEVYQETHGFYNCTGKSFDDVVERFTKQNPDYKILNVKTDG